MVRRTRDLSRNMPRGSIRNTEQFFSKAVTGLDIIQIGRKVNLGFRDIQLGKKKQQLRNAVTKQYGKDVRVFDITTDIKRARESRDQVKSSSKNVESLKFEDYQVHRFQDKSGNQWYAVTGENKI